MSAGAPMKWLQRHGAAAALGGAALLLPWMALAQDPPPQPAPADAPAANSTPAASDAPPASDAQAPAQAPAPVATIPVREQQRQEAPAAPGTPAQLDDVVVTAQKKVQTLRDVPISMSVLSEKFVATHGIVDIVQAMQFVPNVKIASAGFFAAPQARGFSFNNNNKAFESPLGIAFDGIPYTNTTYFNSGLFDIQRVEVLRGPQGTTFGKNTTAGLVSVITADPTPEFSGLLALQTGQLGRKHIEGAFSGPLIADLADFRIAVLKDDLSGFVHNTTAAIAPAADALLRGYAHNGYRAKLKFPDLWGTQLKLSYEAVEMSSLGAGIELWDVTEPVKSVMRKYDPNADFVLGNLINSEDEKENRLARTRTAVAEWTVPMGDWELTALGGWSELKETLGIDVDFSPVPGAFGNGGDRFPTSTLELRAKSPALDGLFGMKSLLGMDLGHTEFLGGFFLQRRTIRDSVLRLGLNDGPLLELTAAAELPETATSTDQANTYTYLLGSLGLNAAEAARGREVFDQVYDQEGEVMALFQQTDWSFAPKWKLQLGLRASQETKKGYWNDAYEGPDMSVGTALGLAAFVDSRSLKETQFQPKVSLNWQPSRETSYFVHWTRGFKGGGFNAFAYRDVDQELRFKPETTTEWGFDFKGSFFGGTLRPNVSVYLMNAKDFQVLGREKPPVIGNDQTCIPILGVSYCVPPSAVIGLGATRVFNAEHARAQGVEADVNWLAGGFALLATLGYNDTKYLLFSKNECPQTTTATTCDATGKSFAFAPRWDSTLTPSYILPLPWFGLSLTPSFTAQYISREFLDTHLSHQQAGFMRYNANVSLASVDHGWTLQIIGNNLSDVRTAVRYGDVLPHFEISVPEGPRQVFVQFRYAFAP